MFCISAKIRTTGILGLLVGPIDFGSGTFQIFEIGFGAMESWSKYGALMGCF
jgi:hypothetical protein